MKRVLFGFILGCAVGGYVAYWTAIEDQPLPPEADETPVIS